MPFYSWSLRLTPLPPLPLPLVSLALSLFFAALWGWSCVVLTAAAVLCARIVFSLLAVDEVLREAITRAITWGGITWHVLPRAKLIKCSNYSFPLYCS